jgi:N-acetylmuramoyl-L-alanine amidase
MRACRVPQAARRSGCAAGRTSRRVAAASAIVALIATASGSYQVRSGDTLSHIAAREGTTVAALVDVNGLDDPDRIFAGQRLELPATDVPDVQRTTGRATPSDRAAVGALIEDVAAQHGWSPAFVKALAWQESGWNNDRVSTAGAVGIMQVMPGTGEFVGQRLLGRQVDLTDPRDNVVAGVVFLQHLWELTDGDTEQTLAGYYQGLASVRQNGRYPSTERYIDNVLALRERFR